MNKFSREYNIVNETLNFDSLFNEIYDLLDSYKVYKDNFVHHKVEEKFLDVLERQIPTHKHKIEIIYSEGRDICHSILDTFSRLKHEQIYFSLNSFILFLEKEVTFLKSLSEETLFNVRNAILGLNFYRWSVDYMIIDHEQMIIKFDRILTILDLLKSSKTFLLHNGIIKMDDINNSSNHQVHLSGNFQNTNIQTGQNSTMNINQIDNHLLQEICLKMNMILEAVNEIDSGEKISIQQLISKTSKSTTKESLSESYTQLTSFLSNHITIFSAFASAGLIQQLGSMLS